MKSPTIDVLAHPPGPQAALDLNEADEDGVVPNFSVTEVLRGPDPYGTYCSWRS